MAIYLKILHNCENSSFGLHSSHIRKKPWVANGPQNGFTGPRSCLWLFDKALKPDSLSLFNEKPIGLQRPTFGPNLGLPSLGMLNLSPKIGFHLTLMYSLAHW